MKNHDTNKLKNLSIVFALVFASFLVLSIFVFNGRGITDNGFILPQSLKVRMTPTPIDSIDSISTYETVRRTDEMIRQMYAQTIESSQGGNQLKLFFSAESWSNPWNLTVYIGSMLIILLFFLGGKLVGKRTRTKSVPWTERLLENNLHYIIPIALVAMIIVSMINLSLPFNKSHRNDADPVFVLISLTSLTISLYALFKMLSMVKDNRFTTASKPLRKSHRRNTLLWAAFAGWMMAFLCFFIGMYTSGTQKSLLTNLLRPALSATKMFVLADSPGDLSYILRQSGAYMGFYSFTKLYVIIITSISLLSLVWYRISSNFRLRWEDATGKKVYIFWGYNTNTLQMAKEVRRHHQDHDDAAYLMLFIDHKENASDAFLQSPSVAKFFNLFTHNRESFEAVEELGAHILIIETDISGQECNNLIKAQATNGSDLWKDLELTQAEEFIRNASETHMFFLEENENRNIQGTLNMAGMLKLMKNIQKVTLYSQARKEGMGNTLLTIEGEFPDKRVEIRILDTSSLAVKTLIHFENSKYHPINYVRGLDSTNAAVGAPFNCCVIGFGETGQDMTSFLYEFGAFLDSRCAGLDSEHTFRSPFHCDIYDKDATMLKEYFKVKAPEAIRACNVRIDGNGHAVPDPTDPMLRFHNGLPFDGQTSPEEMPDLSSMNYIVLCLGRDESNMSTLSMLMDMLVKARDGRMDHLIVLVRNYEKANEEAMRRLQAHYNSLYGDDARNVVRIFGEKGTLFTYDIVVGDIITTYAKRFYDHFRRINKSDITWDQRHAHRTARTRLVNDRGIMRKENQDIENYIHIATKLQLMGIGPDGLYNISNQELIRECAEAIKIVSEENGISTVSLGKHQQLITNLARTEHLRWNASHEMLGYSPAYEGTGCNELTRTHNCLVSWELLPEVSRRYNEMELACNPNSHYLLDYRTFDYIVVLTTMEIAMDKIKKITQTVDESTQAADNATTSQS